MTSTAPAAPAVCEVCNAQPPTSTCAAAAAAAPPPLLACSECGLVVHAKCFGLDSSSSSFTCTECACRAENLALWGAPDADANKCLLCPVSSRELKRGGLKVLVRNQRRLGYAHALCGLYLPLATVTARHVDISLVAAAHNGSGGGEEEEDAECAVCHTTSSSAAVAALAATTTKCSFPECTVRCHASCAALAHEAGFELSLVTLTSSAASLTCPCHSTSAVRFPERAEAFVNQLAEYKARIINNVNVNSAGGAAASSSGSSASTAAVAPSPAGGKKKPAAAAAKRKSGGASSASATASAPPPPLPLPPKTCDATWLHRRVSIFDDETVGTIVAMSVVDSTYTIALDDGETKLERAADAVTLIPARPAGCQQCKLTGSAAADGSDDMLLCDLCDVELHLGCAKPALTAIPEGKWFCDECNKKRKRRLAELAAKAKQEEKQAKLLERQEKLEQKRKREKEQDEEYTEKRKKQRSSLRLQTKDPTALATTSGAEQQDAALVPEEQDVDFDGRFPELTASDWAGVWQELFLVQRVEVAAAVGGSGGGAVPVRCKPLLVASKFQNKELPLPCVEGYVLLAGTYPVFGSGGEEEEAQARAALEACVGRSLMHVDAYVLPELPQLLGTAASPPTQDVVAADEAQQAVVDSALAKCDESPLMCIDFAQLVQAAAARSPPLPVLADVMDKLRLDCDRVFARATLPAFRARELFRKLQPRLRLLLTSAPLLPLQQSGGGGEASAAAAPPPLQYRVVAPPKRPLFHQLSAYQAVSTLPPADQEQTMRSLATQKHAPPHHPDSSSSSSACQCYEQRLACCHRNAPLELIQQTNDGGEGGDLEERDVFGFDQPTRKFIDLTLELAAGLRTSQQKNLVVDAVLVKHLRSADVGAAIEASLAALQQQQQQLPSGFSYVDVLRGLQALQVAVGALFPAQVQARLKGTGYVTRRALPARTYVGPYLGEVYPAWRWFERQDNIKLAQSKVFFKPTLPEMLPLALERHVDDPAGYDVVFVDPTVMGNFLSRLQHSCDPNCGVEVVADAASGQYQLALYATRDVAIGEELTINRAKCTEEESELVNSGCVCGLADCRGSFLTWTGTSTSFSPATTDALTTSHNFLDRVAVLLLAGMEPFAGENDSALAELLQRSGFGQCLLPPESTPPWLKTWAAHILRFIEHENDAAQARRQNLAVTCSKLAYFLRSCGGVAGEAQLHPLRTLAEDEVAQFLWSGDDSIGRRAVEAARRVAVAADSSLPSDLMPQVDALVQRAKSYSADGNVITGQQARALLRELAELFWTCAHPYTENCGDVLLMYALTETWFAATAYSGFKSVPLTIRNVDIGKEAKTPPAVAAQAAAAAAVQPKAKAAAAQAPPTAPLECFKEQLVRIHFSISSEKQRISKDQPLMRGKTLTVFSSPVPGSVEFGVHRDPVTGHCSIIPPLAEEEEGEPQQQQPQPPRPEAYFSFHAFPADDTTTGNLASVVLQAYRAAPDAAADAPVPEITFQTVRDPKLIKYLAPGDSFSPPPAATILRPAATARTSTSSSTAAAAKKEPVPPALRTVYSEPKRYQAGFAWGQLVGWWKQTVSDPSASLSAERRGSLSLPDVETCFNKDNAVQDKFVKCRRDMLKKIKDRADGMWPVTWPYSFRNKDKIYGSPWFDDALEGARAGDFARRTTRAAHFLQLVSDHLEATNQQQQQQQ